MRRIARVARQLYLASENVNYEIGCNGEALVIAAVAKASGPGATAFDVGANVGEWTTRAAGHFSRVVSFEVVPAIHRRLAQACQGLGNVTLENLGLGETSGELTFHYAPERGDLASAVGGLHGGSFDEQSIRCPVVTGDEYCAARGVQKIDLLKVDVEGFEPQVLRGFKGMLHAGAVRVVQVEYNVVNIHTRWLLADYYTLFREFGMMVGKIYPDHVEFREYRYEHEDFLGPNYLAVRATDEVMIRALQG